VQTLFRAKNAELQAELHVVPYKTGVAAAQQ
jgi:hypothetical protein